MPKKTFFHNYTHTHTCMHACRHTHRHTIVLRLFWILSGTTRVSRYQKGKTRKLKPVWIYCSKRHWMAVASAGPYADVHLTPDNHANIPPLSFLQAGCPPCHPTNNKDFQPSMICHDISTINATVGSNITVYYAASHTEYRCSLLLRMFDVAWWSACLSVSMLITVVNCAKIAEMNWSRCLLGCWLVWASGNVMASTHGKRKFWVSGPLESIGALLCSTQQKGTFVH